MKINKPISSVIIFIIVVVLVFLFLVPTYKKMNNLRSDVVKKQAEYDGKFIYYAKIADLIKSIDEKKDALEKIDSALPSDFYFSSLVYFFQKEAVSAGLSVTSITLSQISPPKEKTKIRDIIFKLNMSGTYDNFKEYLASLDQSARLFEVNSILFSSAKSGAYNFDMEVKTHAY